MTMQIKDIWKYNDHIYCSNDIEHKDQLFIPESFGFIPEMMSTACCRGYFCEYKITDNQLLLDSVVIRNATACDIKINNKSPRMLEQNVYSYKQLNMPIHYTDRMIVCNDYLNNCSD